MRFSRWTLSAVALVALTSILIGNSPNVFVVAKDAESKDAEPKVDTYVPPKNSKHFQFQAEVHKMLDIVVNSLYQNKDVFLRELISNASDALDKLRFMSLTKPSLLKDKEELEIRIEYDSDAGTLTVRDSGIGMSEKELIENLGTVARSGTTKFVEAMQQKKEGDLSNLIGQFGVGFYSSFLVADRVTVASKSPDSKKQLIWESLNGAADFHVYEDPRGNTLGRGTEITLHLKEDCLEFLDQRRVKELVKHYSEFIIHPIHIRNVNKIEVEEDEEDNADDAKDEKKDDEDEDADVTEKEEKPKKTKEVTTYSWEEINNNPAIWTRDKDEITDDEYQAFWKVLSNKQDVNATTWSHFKAEGNINFKSILYLPPDVPDHYRYGQIEAIKGSMRLYVRRVLISDEFELMPRYLGFIRGVIDSDDLPLNVNRETLQESKIIKVIKKKLVRKAIDMISGLAKDEVDAKTSAEAEVDADGNVVKEENEKPKEDSKYLTWYKKFAPSVKMGIIDDHSNRAKLTALLRYKTSKSNGTWVSLADYVQNMKKWQDEIYVLGGISVEELEKSPFLEPFREKDVEVIYFTDPVDEYVMHEFREFQGKKLVSISSETIEFKDEDEDLKKRREKAYNKKFKPLTKWLKDLYGNSITRVTISKRLGSSPAIVSNSEYGHSANMERIMRSQVYNHDQEEQYVKALKVFEINPRHPIVLKLLEGSPPAKQDKDAPPFVVSNETKEAALLLYDIAMLSGGFQISDPAAHSRRMMNYLQSQLSLESLKLEAELDPPAADEEAPDVDPLESKGINADDFNLDDLDLDDA